MLRVLHEANKAKTVGMYSWDRQQTGTCVLVSILLCQPPNWEQLAQRLFYMAEHDRLQFFHCFCFLNGAIGMELWLELSFTSCKLPENERWSRAGHCYQMSGRAVLLHASDEQARVGYRGGGGNNEPLISISVCAGKIRGCHPRTK